MRHIIGPRDQDSVEAKIENTVKLAIRSDQIAQGKAILSANTLFAELNFALIEWRFGADFVEGNHGDGTLEALIFQQKLSSG